MSYIIKRIDEADFGCEERMPGEPLMVLVTLENEDGDEIQIQAADAWLISQDLNEGDEWPEAEPGGRFFWPENKPEGTSLWPENRPEETSPWHPWQAQEAFMANYMDALEEMDEE